MRVCVCVCACVRACVRACKFLKGYDEKIIIEFEIIEKELMQKMTRHRVTILSIMGSWVSLWNFETIRGSLMKPKWQKLASLAQEICTL